MTPTFAKLSKHDTGERKGTKPHPAWKLHGRPDSVINTSEPTGKQQGEEYRVPLENDIKHVKDQKSATFSILCLSELMTALLKSVLGQNIGIRTQQSWSLFL